MGFHLLLKEKQFSIVSTREIAGRAGRFVILVFAAIKLLLHELQTSDSTSSRRVRFGLSIELHNNKLRSIGASRQQQHLEDGAFQHRFNYEAIIKPKPIAALFG
jgi:hypothetical protein